MQENVQNVTDDAPSFGFNPIENDLPRAPEKQTQSPECRALREQINRLLIDFPEIALRSSQHTMEALEQYDAKELQNIVDNFNNDLRRLRGRPSAEFALNAICYGVEGYIPGYTERCQNDSDLTRDLESEMTQLFGFIGRRANLFFRFINNAYTQYTDPEKPYNNWSEGVPQQDPPGESRGYAREVQVESDGERKEYSDEEERKRGGKRRREKSSRQRSRSSRVEDYSSDESDTERTFHTR